MADSGSLLEIKDLRTHFIYKDFGTVRAVDGVDFSIKSSQTMGLVGESGCGKSVTALSILRLLPEPPATIYGKVSLFKDGEEIVLTALPRNSREIRAIRGHDVAMIFQEPMTSLNPVYSIGNQIAETLMLHQDMTKKEAREKAIDLLDSVGIDSPSQRVDNYAHQLSGGMRQRALIAMAISCNPRLLIADEPTTALDVTIQAQILELMTSIQQQRGMFILMITHDLGVIAEMAEAVAVMYLGKIVEFGTTIEIFENPLHPYTRGLLRSIPMLHKGRGRRERIQQIPGVVPEPYDAPEGCYFGPRCSETHGACAERPGQMPPLFDPGGDGHLVRCWHYQLSAVKEGQHDRK